MLNAIKASRERRLMAREIDNLVEHVLDDLDISRSGLRKLSSTSSVVMQRLTAMATRHHVSQPTLSSNLDNLSVLAQRCGNCAQTRVCAAFLADDRAGSEQAAFCPNHVALSELSAHQKQGNRLSA